MEPISLENLLRIRPVGKKHLHCLQLFKWNLTDGIDVKEPARRPRDAFEHVVMQRHRGSHAEDKESDGSDDGDNTKAAH